MSEFKRVDQMNYRWSLLTTASAIALLSACHGATASDNDHSSLWIELGGQFAQHQTDEEIFSPAFLAASPFDAASKSGLERSPPSNWNGTARLSFQPAGSDLVLSAAILYGRSGGSGSVNQQTAFPSPNYGQIFQAYQIFTARSGENHFVLDFQAGKDVGLGMFGHSGQSRVNLGVRYVHFLSRSSASIRSQPTNVVAGYARTSGYHKFYASFAADRKFTGIGPSLSWDASIKLIGEPTENEVTFDWGLNGAVLFGRQRAQIHHQTTNEVVIYRSGGNQFSHYALSQRAVSPSRNRQVTVPNLGGFAGISWRYPNAKVSLGYRADFFFGAMDAGIDAAKRGTVGFYGPFATVSVGLGD